MIERLAGYLSGVGFSAPEQSLRLKEGLELEDKLPEAALKRIDDTFRAVITHKNQFGAVCFTATIEEWGELFCTFGCSDFVSYGSFSRQLIYKGQDKAHDMDFCAYHPGADKKGRGEDFKKILEWIVKKMYPAGNAPPNEIHRLQRTLFTNFYNKDGKDRYTHLRYLMFSLDSSIQLYGKDHPLKIDFIISGNEYPLLFSIDRFRISVRTRKLLLNRGLQDILELHQKRLVRTGVCDELSFIKLLNRRIQGYYLSPAEEGSFREPVFNESLHRKKRFKMTLAQVQQKALSKYVNCSISLTVFAFQLRLFLQRDLNRLERLQPISNPATWQERLVNWIQRQLYDPAFFDKIPTLTFLLFVKMVEGEGEIRIYEEALRVTIRIQKVGVTLFLPVSKLESSPRYAAG